jgi:5-methylcytosine-specific restriction endonuclease McrA
VPKKIKKPKVKHISLKSLRKKLDCICSEIVRGKGKCQRCGKRENLQTAHIFGRTYNNTRWDLDNLLCLCPDCHINFAHKQPILFSEFVRKILGEEKYELLKESHYRIAKYTLSDLQIKYEVLKEILKDKNV